MNTTKTIPLKNIPNQELFVVLDDQNCRIRLYQRGDHLFLDLSCNNLNIMQGIICGTNRDLVTYSNPYFKGMLFFADLTGAKGIPNYLQFNSRFLLCFSPDEGE